MQKRFRVYALTMLSITCEAALAAQLTSAQKIDRVTTLLKSLETRDLRPLAYIGSSYTSAQSAGRGWPGRRQGIGASSTGRYNCSYGETFRRWRLCGRTD
jgi:hypothetical protein